METDGLGAARGCFNVIALMLGVALIGLAIYAGMQWQRLEGASGTIWSVMTITSGALGITLLVLCYLSCLRSTEQNQ